MAAITLDQILQQAIGHHQAGRLAEAEALYRQILAVQPNHADALHLLGVIASQVGKDELAVTLIRRALAFHPKLAAAVLNLGNSLRALGRCEEAVDAYRQGIVLQPDFPEAYVNLGVALRDLHRLDEAVAAGRHAIALRPEFAEAHYHLAKSLTEQAAFIEAADSYRTAVALHPQYVAAWNELANLSDGQGCPGDAADIFRRGISLNPTCAELHNNCGNLLARLSCFDEAEATFRRGLAVAPDFAVLYHNLGDMLKELGRIDEALSLAREAVRRAPADPHIGNNLLAFLQYSPGATPSSLLEAHCEFDRIHHSRFRQAWSPHPNSADPERLLRVGMVSPHFSFHPVGHFLIGVLENLDRARFEVIGYSDTKDADAMTARLRAAMVGWRDVRPLQDAQLAARIREDRVDVLFDLAGHTAGNRLAVFARKPAPIQITWLDYVGTTGLSAMDYILGDPREIPPGAEPFYREKVLRMPDDYICYDPPADAPGVGLLPALGDGCVTFASFNIPAKTTPEIVRVWARILGAVPGSRLLLKNRAMNVPSVRQRYGAIFAEAGVAATRVEFRGWSPSRELLTAYNEADIALDTWPYNGGLTTCEALWMGVPVVTCPGETFASRHGLSHLAAAGIEGTVARDLEHYVEIAAGLAKDLPALAILRATMRAQMAASPLCDGRRFADHFMATLRDVWRRWCADAPA